MSAIFHLLQKCKQSAHLFSTKILLIVINVSRGSNPLRLCCCHIIHVQQEGFRWNAYLTIMLKASSFLYKFSSLFVDPAKTPIQFEHEWLNWSKKFQSNQKIRFCLNQIRIVITMNNKDMDSEAYMLFQNNIIQKIFKSLHHHIILL